MIENRYFFYIVMLNMVSNIVVFVPHVLIEHRFDSAMTSIAVSVISGLFCSILFSQSISKFPGETMMSIMRKRIPGWITVPVIVYVAVLYYLAGAISLLSFAEITKRYIAPESSPTMILLYFLLLVLCVTPIQSGNLLRGIEVLFVVNIPIIALVLLKSLTGLYTDWPGVFDVYTHSLHGPSYEAVASGSYVFTGYINLIVFNDSLHYHLRKRHYLLLASAGLLTLLTSFTIPILRLGEFAVGSYVFPWISTADSVDLPYFLIERMGIPFLVLYLLVTMVTTIMIWHVGYRLFQSVLPPGQFVQKWSRYAFMTVFAGGLFTLNQVLKDESQMFHFTTRFMNVRYVSEFAVVGLMIYMARWQRRGREAL